MWMKVTQRAVCGCGWGLTHAHTQTDTYTYTVFHRVVKVGPFSRAEPLRYPPFIFLLCLKSLSLPAFSKHRQQEHKLTSWITVRPTIQSQSQQSKKKCADNLSHCQKNKVELLWERNIGWNYVKFTAPARKGPTLKWSLRIDDPSQPENAIIRPVHCKCWNRYKSL